jgi:hypothetical protein
LCLFQKLNTNLETAKAVIVACCVLHNLSIEWNGFEDEDHDDDDNIRRLEQPAQLMPQKQKRNCISSTVHSQAFLIKMEYLLFCLNVDTI